MDLQTILYGQFTPPPVVAVRRHSCWAEPGKAYKNYTPPKKYAYAVEDYQNMTSYKMIKLIEERPGICVKELCTELGRVPSYIYRIRDILLEQKKIITVRGKPPRRGGPVTSLFYIKEKYAG